MPCGKCDKPRCPGYVIIDETIHCETTRLAGAGSPADAAASARGGSTRGLSAIDPRSPALFGEVAR